MSRTARSRQSAHRRAPPELSTAGGDSPPPLRSRASALPTPLSACSHRQGGNNKQMAKGQPQLPLAGSLPTLFPTSLASSRLFPNSSRFSQRVIFPTFICASHKMLTINAAAPTGNNCNAYGSQRRGGLVTIPKMHEVDRHTSIKATGITP